MNNEKHAYWIHKKIANKSAVRGYFFSRECTCSECGKEVNMEKETCPFCSAIMNGKEFEKNQLILWNPMR